MVGITPPIPYSAMLYLYMSTALVLGDAVLPMIIRAHRPIKN